MTDHCDKCGEKRTNNYVSFSRDGDQVARYDLCDDCMTTFKEVSGLV